MRRTLRMAVHRTSKIVLGFVPLLVAGLALFQACRAQSGPTVWVAPGSKRVAQTEAVGTASTAQIRAARGETESFQIVVKAPAGNGLTNVNVSVSDLTGAGTIPKTNLSLFREHYVSVSPGSVNWRGTNQPLGAGVYADGLIPFTDPATGLSLTGATLTAAPFAVAAGLNQPVWVDVFVPRDAPAGLYNGSFTVTSNQGNFTGQISLQVWNFTLPLTPSLQSSFSYWVASGPAANAELLKHRLTPLAVPAGDQATLISKYGLGTGNLGYWSGADAGNCSMSTAPSVTQIQNSVKNNQPSLKLFNFTADEIGSCTSLYPQIQQWARNLHQAGVDNLITMTPVSQLLDDGSGTGRSAVDIWVLLPLMYQASPSMVATVLQKGDKAWSSNTLVQDSYSPKWEIDFDPINFRIQPGFINQSLGLNGLLYWRIDRWSSDPWNQVNTTGQFSTNNYPGEGMLVYPGTQVGVAGVVASMRLKWLRDGADDFDYITLLKAKGYGDWALQLSRSVGPNWTSWTRDANLLESVRNQLGAKLDELAGPVAAPGVPLTLSPSNGATVSATPALAWAASAGATSYKVYLGTSTTPALAGSVTGTSFSPGKLIDATRYYWRVEAVNNGGTSSSSTWSFLTETPSPSAPVNVSPANGATLSTLTPALQWGASNYATAYDVYLGTSASPALVGTVTGTTYTPGALNGNGTYYWKVVAKNNTGSTTSAVWSFQTPVVLSGTPSNPVPANGATGVSLTPSLSWSGVTGATSFDVYFGTSTSPPLAGNVAAAVYNPGTLSANTTYYWRVVAKNGSSTGASTTWSFRTLTVSSGPAAPVVVGLTPSSGSGSSAALTSVISDNNGFADIAGSNLLINSSMQGSGGCWVYFDTASQRMYMANDRGTSWTSGTIGSSTVLQNSQCSLSLSQVSMSGAGPALSLYTPLVFKSSFKGQKTIYVRASDKGGLTGGYLPMGSWTLP